MKIRRRTLANYNERFHSAESGKKDSVPILNEIPLYSFRKISGGYFEKELLPRLLACYQVYRDTGTVNREFRDGMNALTNHEKRLLPITLLQLVELCERIEEEHAKKEALGLLDCLDWEFGIKVMPKYDVSMN